MCRSIKTLRNSEHDASPEDIEAAALQFVRKVSGYRKPSKRNTEAFSAAVDEIAEATYRLLNALEAARSGAAAGARENGARRLAPEVIALR
jgi:hypothetical protein